MPQVLLHVVHSTDGEAAAVADGTIATELHMQDGIMSSQLLNGGEAFAAVWMGARMISDVQVREFCVIFELGLGCEPFVTAWNGANFWSRVALKMSRQLTFKIESIAADCAKVVISAAFFVVSLTVLLQHAGISEDLSALPARDFVPLALMHVFLVLV